MELKVLEKKETFAKFLITDTSAHVINALRRTMIADVPKMAIEDVEFHLGTIRGEDGKEFETNSPLFDEMIAHRLGLLPIPTDLALFGYRDKCSCNGEGCPNCTIMYTLNKKGPCTIYSGDLEPIGDAKYKIPDAGIPITKLTDGEGLLIYATAVLGTGSQHAKWQPTSAVGFKHMPKIKIDSKKCKETEACVKKCPRKIFKMKSKKPVAENVDECTLCMACVKACQAGAIQVEGDTTRILLTVETDGALPVRDVVMKALDILEASFKELETLAKGLEK